MPTALKKGDLELIAGAYAYFIEKGTAGSEGLLVKALDEYGHPEMATDYLNCENKRLSETARKWAARHRYPIISGAGGGRYNPTWSK